MTYINYGLQEITRIKDHRWNQLDFEFECKWADGSTTWQCTSDMVQGNCDAVISDYLKQLLKEDFVEYEIIFNCFYEAKKLQQWWDDQFIKEV